MIHPKRVIALAAAAALTACLASCAQSSTPSGSSSADGQLEVTEVKGLMIRATLSAPFVAAQEEGFAKDQGLTLSYDWADGSAAAVAQLISGDTDVALSSYFGVIDAARQGIDVVVVGNISLNSPKTSSLETLPDSGITSLKHLEGKTIGVSDLASIHKIYLEAEMLRKGFDPSTITFVAVPFGDMATSLELGHIDAGAFQGMPLALAKESLGVVTVHDYGVGSVAGMPQAGWIMKRTFVDANPNTVSALQCALAAGTKLMAEDDEAFAQVSLKAELTNEKALAMTKKSDFNFDLTGLQKNVDVLVETGALKKSFDVSSIVIPAPDTCK